MPDSHDRGVEFTRFRGRLAVWVSSRMDVKPFEGDGSHVPEGGVPPLEPEFLAELDCRLAEFEADSAEGRPAAEVIARVRATLR